MSGDPGEFFLALARHSAAGGVLVLLVLPTQWLFRKQLSPRWHCALWLLVIVRLLPFSFSTDVSIFNLVRSTGTLPVAEPVSTFDRGQAARATAENLVPNDHSIVGLPARRNVARALFYLWLGGVIALSAYVLIVSSSFARRLRRLRPLDDSAVDDVLRNCCERMGVRRAPAVVESSDITAPALHGFLRPRLLLPVGFTATFSRDELRFVLLHELAHLRRRDLLLNWVMTALQIIHWFNPLVWLAYARWRIDRELACDAAALEVAGADCRRAYGETMLRLLETLAAPARRPGLVGILEDKHQLRRRVAMIAGFAPARPSLAAAGLFSVLAIVGLTDAQPVSPASTPTGSATSVSNAQPISESEIDAAIAKELAGRFENDRAKFLAYLRSQGKTVREFRKEMEQEIRERLTRPAQDTPPALNQSGPPGAAVTQVHVRLIQLTRNEGDTDEILLNRANRILARFRAGEKFDELAKELSDDKRRAKGGDWGWQKRADFRPQFGDVAFSLGKGEASAPILVPEGCFILFVVDRK